ncbi:MAG: cytochrome c oxidase accessory protein CcoG [Nitrospinota bacterium]
MLRSFLSVTKKHAQEKKGSVELFESHKKVIPESTTGVFRNLKTFSATLFLGLYFFSPWIRWNDRQAIFLNLGERKFHLFSLTLWPQEIYFLAALLFILAVLLFLLSALFGRVFCGFFCFQTLFTDFFILVEKKILGKRKKRMRFYSSGVTVSRITRLLPVHSIWIMVSLFSGYTFTLYFANAPDLTRAYLSFTAPQPAVITFFLIGLIIYSFAGFFREHVCFYFCPYARFQGSMEDDETLVITYDKKRGDEGSECIQCKMCSAVCPTGIDIRDGTQYRCVSCGLCIDACEGVLGKKGVKGLIGFFTSDNRPFRETRLVRPRTIIYSLILFFSISFMAYQLATRRETKFNVIHERLPLYIILSDGSIKNRYTLKISNRSGEKKRYTLSISGNRGLEILKNPFPLTLPEGTIREERISLILKKGAEKKMVEEENNGLAVSKVVFTLTDRDREKNILRESKFFRKAQ